MINVVCAVIQGEDQRVLICYRPEGKPMAGKWEFPGGKIEPGEQPETALAREIAEELGCALEVGSRMQEVIHHYPEFSIKLIPFRCRLASGAPQALEHAELRWVHIDQCAELGWAEADIPIWEALLSPDTESLS